MASESFRYHLEWGADVREDDLAGEWRRLQAAQLDLRRALAGGATGAERDELIHQFRINQAAISRLDSEMVDRTSPDTSPADDEVDKLLEVLVYRHENGDSAPSLAPASNVESSTGGERSRRFLTASVLLGVLGIAVGLSLLVGATLNDETDGERSSTGIAQREDVDIAPSADGDEVERALGQLDLFEVKAIVRGSSIVLTGTVRSEVERSEVIDAVLSIAQGMEVDASGLVVSRPTTSVTPPPTLRVGLVGPSAADDGSFTQSMVDGLAMVAAERGNVEIEIAENASTISVATAIRGFAEDDFDLVIAHSSAFMSALMPIAEEYPQVTFAIGTVREASGLPNVYTYAVAAEEGGYVLGALAARLSESNVVGAVGPVDVGTSRRYIDGFRAGAEAERQDVTVLVTYTGSFSDGEAAAAATRQQISAGGDLITGQGHVIGPAIAAAEMSGARWIGNQVSPASIAPETVVASQVYRWDVGLRAIIADIDDDTIDGQDSAWVGDLANGGVALDFSPDLDFSDATRQRVDDLVKAIISGSIDPLPGP